jgi:ubiquinone/menaquinone biosynthesis C-methylase UbiE
MKLNQAIELIQCNYLLSNKPTIWTDLGCGSGLFTNALARFLEPGSRIFALDKNINAFKNLFQNNNVTIEKIKADFINDELNLENLDGIMMANSLHYVKDKFSFIKKAGRYLKNHGCFLIVEYDTDTANRWVPYPLSFNTMKSLFITTGFHSVNKLNETPSRFNRAKIYSAIITA